MWQQVEQALRQSAQQVLYKLASFLPALIALGAGLSAEEDVDVAGGRVAGDELGSVDPDAQQQAFERVEHPGRNRAMRC